MTEITYLTRAQWRAGDFRSGYAVPNSQFRGLVLHHAVMVMPDYDRDGMRAGDLDDIKVFMRALQVARPDLGNEVPYSFVIFPGRTSDSAIVAEGRGKARTGAHTIGYNSTRLGCAFYGNATTEKVTPGVIAGFNWVGANMLENPGHALATFGHRDIKQTECPGNSLYAAMPQIQPPFTLPKGNPNDMFDKAAQDFLHKKFKNMREGQIRIMLRLRAVMAQNNATKAQLKEIDDDIEFLKSQD